jgi:hypothetical protein
MPGYIVIVGKQAVFTKGARKVVRKRKASQSEDGNTACKTRYNVEGGLGLGQERAKKGVPSKRGGLSE